MQLLKESYVENKKSKFYGYLFNVDDISKVDGILEKIKKEHKKAKHVVYAYKINNIEKKYEDKEPSNTAGKPILDIINYKQKNNILIVVVRYFGGHLLGTGLLSRSYKDCANNLFK